jgi:aldose 1-epimerase
MNDLKTFQLKIPNEIEVSIINFGGIIQSLKVPDKKGVMDDVVLGFDKPEDYLKEHPYFGAIIGRYANRINRGTFKLDNSEYKLNVNTLPVTLHGGIKGFDKVVWEVIGPGTDRSITLTYMSPDGEEGFPGNLSVDVTYSVTVNRELIIDYHATTDKPTPINLTNHSYFNLGGIAHHNIQDHELWINANHFSVIDENFVPTGEIFPVTGSKDFRNHKNIGEMLSNLPQGIDHNYVLNDAPLRDPKARLVHPITGRMMEVFTTEPGLQVYTGNFLDGSIRGKRETLYQKNHAICLETQHYPDSPNHSHFPSTILRPGEVFNSKTIYRFS